MYVLSFLMAIAASPADMLSVDAGQATSSATQRRYHEIDRDIGEALRAETRAKTPEERARAVRQMCGLYRELVRDPRLEASDTLKAYKAKLWSRMTRVKRDLQIQLAREQQASGRKREFNDAEWQAIDEATTSLAAQTSLMNYTLGGPGYVFEQSGGAFGGGTVSDHSQELIELIQRTIKPDSWDVNGGQGSIFYFRPLMALVVRATSEVHGDVGGLLHALRRAGN